MEKHNAKKGNLAITVSTYLYFLYDRGITIEDSQIMSLCESINKEVAKPTLNEVVSSMLAHIRSDVSIPEEHLSDFVSKYAESIDGFQEREPFDIGKELVSVIEQSLGGASDPNTVLAWLKNIVPEIHNGWAQNDKQTVLQSIRQYEFSRGLPWIAQIADRTEQGLEEIWVLVEKVTDSVLCMDPYPWDDVDEEFELDLSDFLTRWKLCNCTAIHLP
jgi:hypothetical protein